jgi:hypothetical protein
MPPPPDAIQSNAELVRDNELDQQTGWVVEIHDGKMTRFHAFLSHEEALSAGGIS